MLFNDNYHETLTSYQKEITRDPAKKHLLYLLQSTITICRLTQAACKKNWLLWTTLFPRWRWGKLSWILASWQVVGKVTMQMIILIGLGPISADFGSIWSSQKARKFRHVPKTSKVRTLYFDPQSLNQNKLLLPYCVFSINKAKVGSLSFFCY